MIIIIFTVNITIIKAIVTTEPLVITVIVTIVTFAVMLVIIVIVTVAIVGLSLPPHPR